MSNPVGFIQNMNQLGLQSIESALLLGGLSSMYLLEILFSTRVFLLEKTKDFLNIFVKTEKTPLITVGEDSVTSKINMSLTNSPVIFIPNGLTGMFIRKDSIYFLESMNMVLYQLKKFHDKMENKNIYKMNPFFWNLYDKNLSTPLQQVSLATNCLLHMIMNDMFTYKQIIENNLERGQLISKEEFSSFLKSVLAKFEPSKKSWSLATWSSLRGFFVGNENNNEKTPHVKSETVVLEIWALTRNNLFFSEILQTLEKNKEYQNSFFFEGITGQIKTNVLNLHTLFGQPLDLPHAISNIFQIQCFQKDDVLNYEGNAELQKIWNYRGKFGYSIQRKGF